MIDWLFYTSYGVGAVCTLLGMYAYSGKDNSAWKDAAINWAVAALWPLAALVLACVAAHQGLTHLGAWIRKHNL